MDVKETKRTRKRLLNLQWNLQVAYAMVDEKKVQRDTKERRDDREEVKERERNQIRVDSTW